MELRRILNRNLPFSHLIHKEPINSWTMKHLSQSCCTEACAQQRRSFNWVVGHESAGYWSKDGTWCTFFSHYCVSISSLTKKTSPKQKRNKKKDRTNFFEEGVVSKGYWSLMSDLRNSLRMKEENNKSLFLWKSAVSLD